MYFIATILIGWFLFMNGINLIEFILGIPAGVIETPVRYYVIIGYLVMMVFRIESPLIIKTNANPFTNMKRIELKLFFMEVYYSLWWPYYIVKRLKK